MVKTTDAYGNMYFEGGCQVIVNVLNGCVMADWEYTAAATIPTVYADDVAFFRFVDED